MSRLVYSGLFILTTATLIPATASAQLFGGICRDCCQTCRQPQPQCSCTTLKPVVKTTYRTERQVTYRNETHTACRQEARTEQVPVTRYENVTRDEGGYQMVWVPKRVTRQVARTEYQTRTTYVNVPYQYTRRVPQISTRVVPQRTVSYVPQTVHTAFARPACNTCGPTTAWSGYPRSAALGTPYSTSIAPTAAAPRPVPEPALARRPAPATTGGLVPDPVHLETPKLDDDGDWVTIRPKNSGNSNRTATSTDRLGGFEVDRLRTSSSASGKFAPAPSAAAVFNTRGAILR